MSQPRPSHPGRPSQEIKPSLILTDGGWHVSHLYYSFDRAKLQSGSGCCSSENITAGIAAFCEILDPTNAEAPLRMQTSVVSGHKADFCVVLMDTCPLKIDRVHQRLMASPLGAAIVKEYSFVSVTEISEYVPSIQEYEERLISEGDEAGSPALAAKVKAYTGRLSGMNRQRLTPELPPYPAVCFYPMNKKRKVDENWFMLSKEKRNGLMSEHAVSGRAFAGKVSQLITVAMGFDDWEWGVTLWGANPEYLKEIVYKMRFDEASARYAEFGPFLISYVKTAAEVLEHCEIKAVK